MLHVHHAPSHDSSAALEELLEAAHATRLDFVVLTEHVEADLDAPLPATQAAGLYEGPDGHRVLVLVGAEFGTADGHLLGLDIPLAYASRDRSGRELIARIHGDGGFAVVPHPFDYGGWRDLDAPFDAIEVHNNAVSFRRLRGPLLPLRLLWLAVDRGAASRNMLRRPDRELELWERMLVGGRRVVGLSGAHPKSSPGARHKRTRRALVLAIPTSEEVGLLGDVADAAKGQQGHRVRLGLG